MFNPTYRISPFLIGRLEDIASKRGVVEAIAQRSPLKVSVSRDTFNRSVHSSTWIEGNMLSLAQVAQLSADKNIVADEKQKREVTNCIAALRFALNHKKASFSEQKLLNLHRLMTQGLLPQDRCGHYRKIQNYIVDAKNKIIFTPMHPSKVKPAMMSLFTWLKQHQTEHAIIRSAVFHHEFVDIHPFADGNGRVARAGSQWILWEAGFDPVWTLELDEFFANDRDKYYDMIQQTREMDGDYTHWIEYIADGLSKAVQTVAQRVKEQKRELKNLSLTPKQNELLTLLEKHGLLGSAEICQAMNINRARVNQLIAPLVKAGVVIKEGTTKAVKYRIS